MGSCGVSEGSISVIEGVGSEATVAEPASVGEGVGSEATVAEPASVGEGVGSEASVAGIRWALVTVAVF